MKRQGSGKDQTGGLRSAFAEATADRRGLGGGGAGRPTQRWTPATRVAFRFGFVYLGLFCLVTQISGSMLPNLSFYYRGLGRLWPLREVTAWTARHVFGVTSAIDGASGNGEPLFFWVQTFWLLLVSVLAVAIWSAADRRREHYVTLHTWFRLFVRLALASALFEYGMTKVIPTQFPAPSLTTLVTRVGDLSMSALLWTSIGAAPAYEIFTGCVELLAGVLLLLPRTTMLGAVIGLAAMIQVFALNMAYDIGVKLVSFHLIVLAGILLAPDLPRLADMFVWNRPAGPSTQSDLLRTPRANRFALVAQIVFGAYLLGMYGVINWGFWQRGGGGSPRSALYGIWEVEQLSIDGQVRPPQLNDYDRRWRRVILDAPDRVAFQRTDDSFARYGATIDPSARTLALTKGGSRTWKASFVFERPSPNRLILDGQMDGLRIEARLRLVDFETLRLLNSTFRWVRPHEP
jgi:uncharacterized membrane protein YphA (DoxX/SURF4 family)